MHKYNYSKMLKIPELWDAYKVKGSQILHYSSANFEIKNDESTFNYVQSHMLEAKMLHSDAQILKYAVDKADLDAGLILEFGVGGGRTTNFIAALCWQKTVHGFDSFKGLPEDWQGPCQKGTFALLTIILKYMLACLQIPYPSLSESICNPLIKLLLCILIAIYINPPKPFFRC
jgi:hypothetical protein